jgi:hypothetical protein
MPLQVDINVICNCMYMHIINMVSEFCFVLHSAVLIQNIPHKGYYKSPPTATSMRGVMYDIISYCLMNCQPALY